MIIKSDHFELYMEIWDDYKLKQFRATEIWD
jgi:hypothetical protein